MQNRIGYCSKEEDNSTNMSNAKFGVFVSSCLLIIPAGTCLVGLDVVRTDRTLVFYESEANQAKLWEVLCVYAWVDNNIGYVQGELL